MDFIDYYSILGIAKDASTDTIKKAYRKMARKYHPDLNPDDKEAHQKFQQINEANEVLSDPEKRAKYDKYGKDWKHGEAYEQAQRSQQSRQTGGDPYEGFAGGYSGSFSEDDFSDFFSSMFGSRSGRSRASAFKGGDYRAELHLSLRDVATTHKRTLTVNGKNLRITIPAGVENGQEIRIKGQGGPGSNNGPAGDLYITFVLTEDPIFRRLGNDLYLDKEIDLFTALLGGEVFIETLTGKVKLNVKPETQPDTKVKLKGKGFPIYKKEGHAGDLVVTYKIKLPVGLSEPERKLVEDLADLRKKGG